MAQSDLKTSVLQGWAQLFNCTVADFSRPGTQIFHHTPIDDSDYINVLQLENRAFVEVGARHLEFVQTALSDADLSVPLNAHQVAALCGLHQPQDYFIGAITFVDADRLITPTIAEPFTMRQLNQADAPALKLMQEACSEDEREEGDVGVDHEVAFGCFVEKRMVACASMFYWRGFADIGVLTHPGHRGRGLGRAVTGATARWILDQGAIPVYRHDLDNLGSAGVSRSLGFELFHHHESIKIG